MASRAKKRLDQVQTLLSDRNFKNHIMNFLEKYMECELVCKELIVDYKSKTKEPVIYEDVKIIYNTVQAAVRCASLSINEITIKRIFAANKKKGQRSAKKLRDAIVHGMTKSELKEINQRYNELMKYMRTFLKAIK